MICSEITPKICFRECLYTAMLKQVGLSIMCKNIMHIFYIEYIQDLYWQRSKALTIKLLHILYNLKKNYKHTLHLSSHACFLFPFKNCVEDWAQCLSLLSALAGWKGHGHCMLLCQSCQLLKKLRENDSTVNSVLHPQCLCLFLQTRSSSSSHHATEQSAVKRMATVPDMCQSRLSCMACSRWTVSMPQDQLTQWWLPTLYYKKRDMHLCKRSMAKKIHQIYKNK